jgi:hypothetical protein
VCGDSKVEHHRSLLLSVFSIIINTNYVLTPTSHCPSILGQSQGLNAVGVTFQLAHQFITSLCEGVHLKNSICWRMVSSPAFYHAGYLDSFVPCYRGDISIMSTLIVFFAFVTRLLFSITTISILGYYITYNSMYLATQLLDCLDGPIAHLHSSSSSARVCYSPSISPYISCSYFYYFIFIWAQGTCRT